MPFTWGQTHLSLDSLVFLFRLGSAFSFPPLGIHADDDCLHPHAPDAPSPESRRLHDFLERGVSSFGLFVCMNKMLPSPWLGMFHNVPRWLAQCCTRQEVQRHLCRAAVARLQGHLQPVHCWPRQKLLLHRGRGAAARSCRQ